MFGMPLGELNRTTRRRRTENCDIHTCGSPINSFAYGTTRLVLLFHLDQHTLLRAHRPHVAGRALGIGVDDFLGRMSCLMPICQSI
jgi:hypothetical protein